MNRIVIEEDYQLCSHTYEAWVVIEEADPPEKPQPKMLRAGRVTVSISPFAALAQQPSIVNITHALSRMTCRYPSEEDAYAEALFRLGKIAGGLGSQAAGRAGSDPCPFGPSNPIPPAGPRDTPMTNPTDISSTLAERGSRYGEFIGHACITQALKRVMQGKATWSRLADDQREALEMIAHKIGRILNDGADPDYHDSWHDIVGYAKLVADRLEQQQQQQAPVQAKPPEQGYMYRIVDAPNSPLDKYWILQRRPAGDFLSEPESLANLSPAGVYVLSLREDAVSILSDVRQALTLAYDDERDADWWKEKMRVLFSTGYFRHFAEFTLMGIEGGARVMVVGHPVNITRNNQNIITVGIHSHCSITTSVEVAERIVAGLNAGVRLRASRVSPEQAPTPGPYSLEEITESGRMSERKWKLYQGRFSANHGTCRCIITIDRDIIRYGTCWFLNTLLDLLNGHPERSMRDPSIIGFGWGKNDEFLYASLLVPVSPGSFMTLPKREPLAEFSSFDSAGDTLRADILRLFNTHAVVRSTGAPS